ncbi:alpha/beta-Hydrolases superfamily protein [Klebsormidium nitens]|uniref:Alpha/beta-Hydrolases superfamily protein n=1 Tax=Klebsormidium nitens TaxID=105231 RepID=A0A1Y1IBG5_KLENI|nr:alpha/beta-Hydrolases superfamily protein [Klebsormidium nitens]|eukprot:GAQ87312.1 alpha/beta-Hydrolases superfamily protein [Klebsormidium nitens]
MAISSPRARLSQRRLPTQGCSQGQPAVDSAFTRLLLLCAFSPSIAIRCKPLSNANLRHPTAAKSSRQADVVQSGNTAYARGRDCSSVSRFLLPKCRTGQHRLLPNSSFKNRGSGGSRGPCAATADVSADVSTATELPPFLPKEAELLEDPDAKKLARRIRRLPVMTSLAAEPIDSSFVGPDWAGRSDGPKVGSSDPPVVLLAGFDSSCLEYRRLLPQLERGGSEVWAVDLIGWGFSSATEGKGPAVSSFGPAAKREHLYSFWKTYMKRPMVLVGSSLGGAVAVDLALEHPDAVDRLVLLDAQVFIDGVGNRANLPRWLANAGVQFLRSWPLRAYAGGLAFYNRAEATKGATQAGRLHCLMPGWPEAMMSFMSSGGYSLTARLPQLDRPSLVLWGRQDRILEPSYALRFEKELARSRLEWVEESGHLPHIEQPELVAEKIRQYAAESL